MSFSPGDQREMLAELQRLAEERQRAERQMQEEFESTTARLQQQLRDGRQAAILRFQMDRDATQRQFDAELASTQGDYNARFAAGEQDLEQWLTHTNSNFKSALRRAKRELSEENWEANTVFEATQNAPKIQLEQEEKEITATHGVLIQTFDLANEYLRTCRLGHLAQPAPSQDLIQSNESNEAENPPESAAGIIEPAKQLVDVTRTAINRLENLKQLHWPQLLIGGRPLVLAIFVAAALFGTAFGLFGGNSWTWLIVGAAATAIAAVGIGIWVYGKASQAVSDSYESLHARLIEGETLRQAARAQAKQRFKLESQKIVDRHERELKAATDKFEARIAEITARRDESVQSANTTHSRQRIELAAARDSRLAEANEIYPKRLDEIQERYQRDLRAAQEQFETGTAAASKRRDEASAALTDAWRRGAEKIRAVIEENRRENWRYFPAWNDSRWKDWEPPTTPPPTLRFGQFHVDLQGIPGGISTDERLNGLVPAKFELPALLPFPKNASLLLKGAGEGRRMAAQAVQSLMLRMLTSIPPSKVRFTIIDPVGLGENFAGFMHLADYDEQLVTNRIWTEPAHIEQRLAELTEQMENVIQKYLRNEFQSIDEYNAFAGEVAEPFRILVVANFPVNFTETAARRLTSIATSGARCGVYTLIINDTKQPLPPRFDLKDLERNAATLVWDGKGFKWQDADFQPYPLWIETPPPEEQFTRLVQVVGRGAKEAKRVEVPFDYVAPKQNEWWTGDTSRGVLVPLGRAGATKLQYLKLGEGTSQHVLVAGKTGSGKSTLLHALITNLALTYSPDQIELYLIDFKKGVEFKTYATHHLPHAKVIAIESEREFGVSVIEKLDAELKRRGDLFRDAGVQDVAAYRAAAGPNSLPRIMLIVDEFQELFTDDDKLAQDAALLLDRLVRQGRAFGMHVLLGSQTLGGAYSLARSTIGQMAVRIALQCSEADAHLILSEENSAARLLSRPGEAIYNDANGLVQGNHPFQIVWLSDARREQYLQGIHDLAAEQIAAEQISLMPSQIVFQGNVPADVRRNRMLGDILRAGDWPVQSTPVHGWLGEAIAIKDPTAALFRPQSGSNLLIVGQRAEIAMSMMASAMISLAAQHRPTATPAATSGYAAGTAAQFYVLEHDRPADLPIDHLLADFRGGLSAFSTILPHGMQMAGRRELPSVLAELAREVERRQLPDEPHGSATYVFICDLGRFRDLRRDESDFGFSISGDKPASPSQMLGTILRDGPAVGVYSIVWCDSLNSVNRSLDRQAMREFALRILLQMSANDSSHLIDTPLASKLGPHVAIFQNDEEGRSEKFRPYAWPPLDWLSMVQENFNQRLPAKKF